VASAKEVKALQVDGEHIGGVVNADALGGSDQLVVLWAAVPIVPIQYFRCCEVVEGTLQAACLVDLQAQVQEGVIGTGRVVNTLTLDLTAKPPTKDTVDKGGDC